MRSTFLSDNSEYSRNGDSNPTRLWAQRDAANFIARGKLRDNPENDVGIVQMNNHNVIASLTSDTGRLNTVLSKIVSDGSGKSFLYSRSKRVNEVLRPDKPNKTLGEYVQITLIIEQLEHNRSQN